MARTKQTMQASRAALAKSLRKGAVGDFRSFKRKGQVSASRTTNLAKRTVVSSLLAEEGKFFDTSYNASINAGADVSGAEADPSTVLCLNAMGQGDTASTREGNKTVVTGITIRGLVSTAAVEAAAAPSGQFECKVALVLDTQTTGGSSAAGTQLNSEDVFVNPGAVAGDNTVAAFRNRTKNPGRYRVLRVIDVHLNPQITQLAANDYSSGYASQKFEMYWKGIVPVKHQANNGTIADIADNSFHVIAWGASANLYYNSRCEFKG